LDSKVGEQGADQKAVEEEFRYMAYDKYADGKYLKHVIILSCQWTAASFGTYLLLYLNKYLAGTIYLNYYFDGIAGVVAYIIGKPLYQFCKIKNSFITSNAITLFGATFILLFEGGYISPYFIDSMGCPPSGYPEGSEKDRKYHLNKIIPWFSFTAKVGTHLTFSNSFQASFSDQRVFPLLRRATATGICNFVGRGLTIFAPLVAELDRPLPMVFLLSVTSIAFIAAFFLPSRQDYED
jgi:hypothetical protein